jgi:protease inhibitor Inh
MIRAAGFAAILWAAAPAFAQAPQPAQPSVPTLGDSAKDLIGSWEFSNAERDKICTATFAGKRTKVGFEVTFNDGCNKLFPLVDDIGGWVFPDNDLLRLVDAEGRALIEFSEVEDGIYEAPTPGLGVLFLQNPAAAAGTPAKLPDQMAGDWTIRRGDKPVCSVTLSITSEKDGLGLTVKPGCDQTIARLAFTVWRLDRGVLVFSPARGAAWRFEEIENDTWRRLPETADQITLVRQ